MEKFPWKECFKFLSGAFFVTAGASWYFAAIHLPIPFLGTVMTPMFLGIRGCMHFVFFLLTFYLGFLRKPKARADSDRLSSGA